MQLFDQLVHDAPLNPGVPIAPKRGHRKKFGKHARVMLSGATVDVATKRQIGTWCGVTLSVGLLLDQLIAFAKARGFKVNRKPRK
jgi:hypothetical protein